MIGALLVVVWLHFPGRRTGEGTEAGSGFGVVRWRQADPAVLMAHGCFCPYVPNGLARSQVNRQFLPYWTWGWLALTGGSRPAELAAGIPAWPSPGLRL